MLRLIPDTDGQQADTLLEGLNPSQAQAVRTTDGPVLIIAGAGSGKTRVLTYRMAYLLRSGVHPDHILALTFTNKAAQEMKERIGHLVGANIARNIWAGTFHSIFARILRKEADHLGFTSSFTIYDTDDSTAAIKQVMGQLGISQQVIAPNAVRGRISNAKNSMMSWQEYARNADSIVEKQTGQIYEEYEKRLAQSNAMDFDDLLINMIRLFEHHPQVLAAWQQRFRYLLVDEYQDTNRAQYKVVNMLAKAHRNICVVGDDAQSIYRWRGADIRNILDFERDYSDATVVRLEQNYRSTKVILAAADAVIKNNAKQLKKSLWTENPEGEKITLLSCRDDREEADMVVRTIRSRMDNHGYSSRDVAILYRTNAQSQALEDALRRHNMAYHIVSGVSFYKRKEVKDTIAYLRLLVNPSDSESIIRVINEPARGIGQTSLERLQETAVTSGRTLYDVMLDVDSVVGLQKRIAQSVRDFIGIIERSRSLLETMSPSELAKHYIESTGLPQMYKLQDTDESLDRWNNIERVLDHLSEQEDLDPDLTLTTYLEQIALVSEADDPALGSNRIALMTMHAAKGLEFPLVVIAGMEQGLFPLAKAEQDIGEQEEERRLFYVGITRAREQLVLSYAERRYRFGELVFSRPSMFLSEIDADCFSASSRPMRSATPSAAPTQPLNQQAQQHRQQQYSSSQRGKGGYSSTPMSTPRAFNVPKPRSSNEYSQVPADESFSQTGEGTTIRPGDRVKHPMFGVGTVLTLSGSGQQTKVTVQFSNGTRKQLVLAYARLDVL
ncbi:MAG TPA: UvrD-helicase domain-containing protein [Chlorobiota bacterium]|nr:UvrD-helicase domain-containing protein [Chlorobiota bacterium]